ncbi:MAG: LytTR family transcriptional regulator [Prevotella sp.]|nr:LytTR family transcriptional regulator [Prevotella sp.]
MSKLSSFLQRKYLPLTGTSSWQSYVASGGGIFLLLFLLQPFGISNYQGNTFLMCLGYGVLTTLLHWLCATVFLDMPLRKESFVTNLDYIVFSIALELSIALSITLYSAFIFQTPVTWKLFGIFFYWTFLIWLMVFGIFTLVDHNRMLHYRLEQVIAKTTDEQENITITLHDQNLRGTDLTLPINDLLYLEARKNNVSICYMREGKVTKTEIRSTLTALKAGLPYKNIFQCHRSFLVNINNISSAKGNSNGYQLRLGECTDIIPVSRTYVPGLRDFTN